MNTEKLIKVNLKELRKQYIICFTICFLVVNFIFQITLSLSPLLNAVLLLITIFIIHRLFVLISLKDAYSLVPNKLADDYSGTVKLRDLINEQTKLLPSLLL
jgi:phosphoglycerol transferase MdoB-like AlkP superfamily enzyme